MIMMIMIMIYGNLKHLWVLESWVELSQQIRAGWRTVILLEL